MEYRMPLNKRHRLDVSIRYNFGIRRGRRVDLSPRSGSVKTSVTPRHRIIAHRISLTHRLINGIIDRAAALPPSFSARFSITIRRVYEPSIDRMWYARRGRLTGGRYYSSFRPILVHPETLKSLQNRTNESLCTARRSFVHAWYDFYERFLSVIPLDFPFFRRTLWPSLWFEEGKIAFTCR